jgi:acetate CoA/acetoacetate CoA-transferase beta subunit
MKTISLKDAVALIPDGASLMIGGFMGVGTPERVIDELVRQEKRNLTVIANDTAMPGRGIGKLVTAGLISRTIASHIGLNPEAQQQMIASRMVVELVPQGTLIERIRAGGFGLGGILTPTGVGTVVEEGKRRIDLDGKSFLLETALRANFALVICTNRAQLQSGDRNGSGHGHCYGRTHRTSRRYRSRSRGDASPRCRLPRGQRVEPMDAQTVIARRIAQELREGMLVNLGIGIPTLVANYVPEGVSVFFQTENGLIGTGPIPEEGMAHPTLTDAAGHPVSALPGASTFDSAMSFGLIRGGHLDMTVLGGLQVDAQGRLANWMIPGKMVPGMGGAMDLVSGAKRVIVAMQHTAKGNPKIVKECSLPLTSLRPVDLVVTELAVIAFLAERATLVETAPGVTATT